MAEASSVGTAKIEQRATPPLSVIVLAGGRSSRMGRDKALIPIRGVPLLRRVCDLALQCAPEVWVVSPWIDQYQDILPSSCRLLRETPLPTEGSNQATHGPLVGFAQGLAQIQTDWVLLLACDLPCLRLEVIQDWTAGLIEGAAPYQKRSTGFTTTSTEVIACLPRQAKGWEPLCGFYRRNCLPDLSNFINQGGRSFQRWLADQPVQELPLADTQMLFNCNKPEDLDVFTQL